MNNLKTLRTRIGLTQKQLADKLDTTQQTIGRWETGFTEIPAPHLRDLAILFGCSVDELLGIKSGPVKRRANAFAQTEQGTPWGTVIVTFPFGKREYPIDEADRTRICEVLQPSVEPTALTEWISFGALDNRLVHLNPDFVRTIKFVSDDAEEMPSFASPETYRSLTGHKAGDAAGPLLKEEQERVCAAFDDESDFLDVPRGAERARLELTHLRLLLSGGENVRSALSDNLATSIVMLGNAEGAMERVFLPLEDDEAGDPTFFNLANVAAIETPLEAYQAYLANDVDDDE